MLIKCQECGLQVSDKALSCPHCGISLVTGRKITTKKSRRRLPNGFGRITKLNNQNLRCPYRVTVTVGKDEYGHPIGKLLKPQAYFKTYNDAYEALIEYHRNPCSLDSGITVEELYERWSDQYFKTLESESSKRTVSSAWKYCSSVYRMRAVDIRARHIKNCIDDGFVEEKGLKKYPSPGTKARIKSLWNLMLDFALEYELVDRNYARTFNLGDDIRESQESAKRGHMSFSENEMRLLWKNIDYPYVKVVLIQCYSGWRPQELGLIRLENVDLENWTFTGGMKTAAGKDRTVPIHSSIRGFVKELYDQAQNISSKYLINCVDGQTHRSSRMFTYDKYHQRFEKIVKDLGLKTDHRPHDCRKQFITMAKAAGMDEYAIKRIVGHAINDITEKIYTDRSTDWLKEQIKLIKVVH